MSSGSGWAWINEVEAEVCLLTRFNSQKLFTWSYDVFCKCWYLFSDGLGNWLEKYMVSVISFSFPEIGVENHLSATPKRNQSAEYWNTPFGTYVYSLPSTALEIFFGFAHKRILFTLVLNLPAKNWVSIQTVYYFWWFRLSNNSWRIKLLSGGRKARLHKKTVKCLEWFAGTFDSKYLLALVTSQTEGKGIRRIEIARESSMRNWTLSVCAIVWQTFSPSKHTLVFVNPHFYLW